MEQLLELLKQIQDLAGVAHDAVKEASGGGKPGEGDKPDGPPREGGGEPKPDGPPRPDEGKPPMEGGEDKPEEGKPPFERK